MNGRIPVEEHEFETIALLLVPFQNDHTAQIINMDTMGKLKNNRNFTLVLKYAKNFFLKIPKSLS